MKHKFNLINLFIMSITICFNNVFGVIDEVKEAFTGNYKSKNAEYLQMKNDVLVNIPSTAQDRVNLRKDATNVASDYKKAFEEKKVEYNM